MTLQSQRSSGAAEQRSSGAAEQRSGGFNAVDRGVYISDNLPFLRSLNDECVDLICIDPPFAKNDTFNKADNELKPELSQDEKDNEKRLLNRWGARDHRDAERLGIEWPEQIGSGFSDIWSWEKDVHEDWVKGMEADYPAVHAVIQAASSIRDDGVDAYLCYMAIRLIEMQRVLTPTGSLFLHCDHTANGYIRQLLDSIFGHANFRSEIIWKRSHAKGNADNSFHNNVDSIFYYTKSNRFTWNKPYLAMTEEYKGRFSMVDSDGRRYETGNLKAPGGKGGYLYEWNGVTARWRWSAERMQAAHDAGQLHYTRTGGTRSKSYLDEDKGVAIGALWTDINPLNSQANERTGYSTQKPVELAQRIIAASTNQGDVVLDCFAGCAYSAVAAETLGRRWVACDVNPRAWTVFKRQFSKPSLVLLRCNDETTGQQVIASEPVVTVHGPRELPQRSSPLNDSAPPVFQLPQRKFKVPASVIPEKEMLEMLLELSGFVAWCCGFANRDEDGKVIRTTRNFHLDHIDPKSKEGSNQIHNRAPMCPHHNIRKGNQRIHLSEYRRQIADAREMMVTEDKLIDLAMAEQYALDRYVEAVARRSHPLRQPQS